MKKINVKSGLLAVLLLASPMLAVAEEYPAYNFEPVIVYQDESAKSSKPSAAPEAATTVEAGSEQASAVGALELGLIVLVAVGGFIFVSKRSGFSTRRRASGSTGVSRYLERQGAASGTSTAASDTGSMSGVDRYLQNRG